MTSLLRDVQVVLDLADEHLAAVLAIYDESLEQKEPPGRLQGFVKNVLENQRSALEFVAHAITERFGTAGARSQWPVAPESAKYTTSFTHGMPGVAAQRPDIAAAVERHQPFQPGYRWLDLLVKLTNENKHRLLTPQMRDETRVVNVRGAEGIAFGPGGGISFGPGGGISFGRGGISFQPLQPGKGGISFGGRVFIQGREVDPTTLEPLDGGPKPYTETIYVDWLFDGYGVSARRTLLEIQQKLPGVLQDVSSVAGL